MYLQSYLEHQILKESKSVAFHPLIHLPCIYSIRAVVVRPKVDDF